MKKIFGLICVMSSVLMACDDMAYESEKLLMPDTMKDVEDGGVCFSNDHCNSGLCIDGKCSPMSEIIACAGLCGDGTECRDGRCVAIEKPVETEDKCKNKTCPDGETCINGECRHEDCGGICDKGTHCYEGRCVLDENPGIPCADCTEDEVCNTQTGQCVEKGQCRDKTDCSGGFVCVKNKCVECTAEEDCRGNRKGGYCVENQCVACIINADCGTPAAPVCINYSCVKCTSDEQCEDGLCGSDGRCGECRDNNDCQDAHPGWTCHAESMTCICTDNAQCPSGQKCGEEGACVDVCPYERPVYLGDDKEALEINDSDLYNSEKVCGCEYRGDSTCELTVFDVKNIDGVSNINELFEVYNDKDEFAKIVRVYGKNRYPENAKKSIVGSNIKLVGKTDANGAGAVIFSEKILDKPVFSRIDNSMIKDIDFKFNVGSRDDSVVKAGVVDYIINSRVINVGYEGSVTTLNKKSDIGGFAGYAKNTIFENIVLSNVTVNNDIINDTGNDIYSAGGLVGWAENCTFTHVTASKVTVNASARNRVGGLIGSMTGGSLKNAEYAKTTPCQRFLADNEPRIQIEAVHGGSEVGGVIGFVEQKAAITGINHITNVVESTLSDTTMTGGMIGNLKNATVSYSRNTVATVKGNTTVGGLIGNAFGGGIERVDNNVKNIESLVENKESFVGGMFGYTTSVSVTECRNQVNGIRGWYSVGGFIGGNSGKLTLKYIQNYVNEINANIERTGGFIGYLGVPVEQTNYNVNIENIDSHVNSIKGTGGKSDTGMGGFIGRLAADMNAKNKTAESLIKNVVSVVGALNGVDNVGGFFGDVHPQEKQVKVENVFSWANIEKDATGGIVYDFTVNNALLYISRFMNVTRFDKAKEVLFRGSVANYPSKLKAESTFYYSGVENAKAFSDADSKETEISIALLKENMNMEPAVNALGTSKWSLKKIKNGEKTFTVPYLKLDSVCGNVPRNAK